MRTWATSPRARGSKTETLSSPRDNKLVVSVPRTRKYRVYSLPDLKQQNEFESPLFHGGSSGRDGVENEWACPVR